MPFYKANENVVLSMQRLTFFLFRLNKTCEMFTVEWFISFNFEKFHEPNGLFRLMLRKDSNKEKGKIFVMSILTLFRRIYYQFTCSDAFFTKLGYVKPSFKIYFTKFLKVWKNQSKCFNFSACTEIHLLNLKWSSNREALLFYYNCEQLQCFLYFSTFSIFGTKTVSVNGLGAKSCFMESAS